MSTQPSPISIPIESTLVYPTRYAAFERPGVLFVSAHPNTRTGGFEVAVFDSPRVHGFIHAMAPRHAWETQCAGLYVEVQKGGVGHWKAVYTEQMPYDVARAQRRLIEELTKALAD